MPTPVTRPSNIQIPFAASGAKNVIPVNSSSPLASFADGFPPVTMQPIVAGGIPPQGKDFNGILYDITTHTLWVNAGGQYQFDATLSTAIGGYPIGMVLQTNDGLGSYVSAVNNNTTDFNSSPGSIGTSWLPWAGAAVRNAGIIWCGTSGGSANVQTFTPTPAVTALVAGQTFSGIAGFTNTGSLTVNISGLGAVTVKRDSPSGPIPLVGGEWVAGNVVTLKSDGTNLQLTDTELGTIALLNIGQGLESDGAGNLRVKVADNSLRRTASGMSAVLPISSVNTNQTIALSNNNQLYIATASCTFTAPLSSTLFNGFCVNVYAQSGASTFTPNAADSVNGNAAGLSFGILSGQSVEFTTDGAGNWWPTGRSTPAGAFYPLYAAATVALGPGSYLIDTNGGPFTVTITAAPNLGDSYFFADARNTWATNNLTLARNGNTIMGSATNLICDLHGYEFMLWWNGSDWRLR